MRKILLAYTLILLAFAAQSLYSMSDGEINQLLVLSELRVTQVTQETTRLSTQAEISIATQIFSSEYPEIFELIVKFADKPTQRALLATNKRNCMLIARLLKLTSWYLRAADILAKKLGFWEPIDIFYGMIKNLKIAVEKNAFLTQEQTQLLMRYFTGLEKLLIRGTFLGRTVKPQVDFRVIISENAQLAQRIHELELDTNGLTQFSLTSVLLNNLINLKKLIIRRNDISNRGFEELAKSALAEQLVELTLDTNNITWEGFKAALLNRFVSLKKLFLANNFIGDVGFVSGLLASELVGRLEELRLDNNTIPQIVFTLAHWNKFTCIKVLLVAYNELGDSGFTNLAQSNLASGIETLVLIQNGVTSVSFNWQNLSRFIKLKRLLLSYNEIGNPGFTALTGNFLASQLKQLVLNFCTIDPDRFESNINNTLGLIRKLTFNNKQVR